MNGLRICASGSSRPERGSEIPPVHSGGKEDEMSFGEYGNALEHHRYIQPVEPRSRRRCHCGCGKRATHLGMANGVGLAMGCELSMRRWAKSLDSYFKALDRLTTP